MWHALRRRGSGKQLHVFLLFNNFRDYIIITFPLPAHVFLLAPVTVCTVSSVFSLRRSWSLNFPSPRGPERGSSLPFHGLALLWHLLWRGTFQVPHTPEWATEIPLLPVLTACPFPSSLLDGTQSFLMPAMCLALPDSAHVRYVGANRKSKLHAAMHKSKQAMVRILGASVQELEGTSACLLCARLLGCLELSA